ncbi:MAG: DUF1893 domain-containing protein [Sphaerochaetaceae bacterium]|nr:DUF1893 domain-containing protein [Sphaerochaetaceae bacterium]
MGIDHEIFETLAKRTLPEGISLQMIDAGGTVLFEDSGKWLHPLFSLEHFLKGRKIDTSCCMLHDRISGKAAAGLTSRLGFKYVKADMISALAIDLYERNGVSYIYDVKVDSIMCLTEKLLKDIDDITAIYRIIEERRRIPY